MRAAMEATFDTQCYVLRWVAGVDDTGASTHEPGDGEPNSSKEYDCRLVFGGRPGRDKRTDPGEIVERSVTVRMPLSADVNRATDRIEVNGIRYVIVDTDRGRTNAMFLSVAVRPPSNALEGAQ